MSEEKNEENINEPESLYFINDELKIYNSFEKQEDDQRKHSASLTPLERLKQTVELIIRSYGYTRESLKNLETDNKVTITKRE